MGRSKQLRIVVLSSTMQWSSMFVSEIAKEDIEIIGVVLDVGIQPTVRKKTGTTWQKKLVYHARLALRFPSNYLEKVQNRIGRMLGLRVRSFYERLSHKEEKLFRHITKKVGPDYGFIIDQNRRFFMLDQACRLYNIPLYEVDDVNSQQSLDILKKLGPDLIIGLGTRILKSSVLSIPPLGVLNGHSPVLPNYRGGTTEFWQLVAGEKETGVTIHFMTERVDEGNIVKKGTWPIHPDSDHYGLRILSQFGRTHLWRQAIRAVCRGEKGIPQTDAKTPTFMHPDLERIYRWYVQKD